MFFNKKEKTMSTPNFLSNFCSLAHATTFISALQSLESMLGENMVKDGNVKNALIDTAVSYLESLKAPAS